MANLDEIKALLKKSGRGTLVEVSALEAVEAHRGVKLPDTLKSLLLEFGECGWGGEIDNAEVLCMAIVQTGSGTERVELSSGYDLNTMKNGFGTPKSVVPLFGDGGGNFVCLDYSAVKEDPPMCFYDHDYDKIVPGAESFDVFIESVDIDGEL